MDLSLGLLTALCWGATDFLVGLNARNAGIRKSVFFSQCLGFLMLSAIIVYQPDRLANFRDHSLTLWIFACAAAFATVIGALSLSKAFTLGKATVVAPIITSYGVFTTLLSLASGELLSVQQLLGLTLCVIGVALTAFNDTEASGKKSSGRAVYYAILAAMLYGLSFWLQGRFTLPALGPVIMLWILYALGTLVSTCLLLDRRKNFSIPPLGTTFTLVLASLFNLAGFSAFALGASLGSLPVVTVISTLSGGIAAVLGFAIFKESVKPIQVLGILLVLVGATYLHLRT